MKGVERNFECILNWCSYHFIHEKFIGNIFLNSKEKFVKIRFISLV